MPRLFHFSLGLAALLLFSASGCAGNKEVARIQLEKKQLLAQIQQERAAREQLANRNQQLADEVARAEKAVADLAARASRPGVPVNEGGPKPPAGPLADLAARFPGVYYDPSTGIARLDVELLFESGDATLKPEAQATLNELAEFLKTDPARSLRVVVAGHADTQPIKGQEIRRAYPNNWHLSSARSLAVADHLDRRGISESRLGVVGLGKHQPIADNTSPVGRQQNRRVEIFLVEPSTPLIGWHDSMAPLYR